MPKITTFLWFDTQAEEAAKFYTAIFENSRIGKVTRYGDTGPGPAGSVMTVEFEIDGHPFVGLNGGPHFTFNEAVSFSVPCRTQEEVDYYWSRLTEGGQEVQCGWVKDRFGVSWQVNPVVLGEMLASPDREKSNRAMKAMMTMKKFDIAALQAAFDGK